MMEDHYTLEWRGRQTAPMTLAAICEALEAGDIHSMYQIQDRGKKRLLRDFLEEHQAPRAASSHRAGAADSLSSAQLAPGRHHEEPDHRGHSAPGSSALSPPGKAAAASHGPGADEGHPARVVSSRAKIPSGKAPAWLMATLIGLLVIILPAGLVGAYLLLRPAPKAGSVAISDAEKSSLPTATGPSSVPATPKAEGSISPTSDFTVEDLMEQKSRYVVEVHSLWQVMSENGEVLTSTGSGTGVFLASKDKHAIFVTNRHVIQPPEGGMRGAYGISYKGKELICEVVAVARHAIDLAKIQVELPNMDEMTQTLNMATLDHLKVGQECVAIGNTLGEGISITSGIISRFDEFPDCKMIRTSAPISPGNSGGGLFRKKDGALVGITTGALLGSDRTAQNANLAIPVDYILNELFWQPFQP